MIVGRALGIFNLVRSGFRDYVIGPDEVVDPPLRLNELVEFAPLESERGPRATHVRRLALDCGKCGTRLTTTTCECGWAVESDTPGRRLAREVDRRAHRARPQLRWQPRPRPAHGRRALDGGISSSVDIPRPRAEPSNPRRRPRWRSSCVGRSRARLSAISRSARAIPRATTAWKRSRISGRMVTAPRRLPSTARHVPLTSSRFCARRAGRAARPRRRSDPRAGRRGPRHTARADDRS